MKQFFFHVTQVMVDRIQAGEELLSGFKGQQSGRNFRVDIDDDDEDEQERLTDILERFGCAWQEETN